jgi:hypothetical protein
MELHIVVLVHVAWMKLAHDRSSGGHLFLGKELSVSKNAVHFLSRIKVYGFASDEGLLHAVNIVRL